jgi:hypothetical protein
VRNESELLTLRSCPQTSRSDFCIVDGLHVEEDGSVGMEVGRENPLDEDRVLFGEATGAHSSELSRWREGDTWIEMGLLLWEPGERDQLEVQMHHATALAFASVGEAEREVRRGPVGRKMGAMVTAVGREDPFTSLEIADRIPVQI